MCDISAAIRAAFADGTSVDCVRSIVETEIRREQICRGAHISCLSPDVLYYISTFVARGFRDICQNRQIIRVLCGPDTMRTHFPSLRQASAKLNRVYPMVAQTIRDMARCAADATQLTQPPYVILVTDACGGYTDASGTQKGKTIAKFVESSDFTQPVCDIEDILLSCDAVQVSIHRCVLRSRAREAPFAFVDTICVAVDNVPRVVWWIDEMHALSRRHVLQLPVLP